MSITPEFLAAIQNAGWKITAVDSSGAIAKCGNPGCSLQIRLEPNRQVPPAWDERQITAWTKVTDIDGLRQALRKRREDLALTIPEVEAEAGLVESHLNKIEKDFPSKIPNIQTMLWLLRALGLSIYLAPDEFPKPVLRALATTRDKIDYRRLRVRIFRNLRRLKAM